MVEVIQSAGTRENAELEKINEQHQAQLKEVSDKNDTLLKLHEAH